MKQFNPKVKNASMFQQYSKTRQWRWVVELIFDAGSVSVPEVNCSWRGTWRWDPSCHERQCQARQNITRQHTGLVLVQGKHNVVDLALFRDTMPWLLRFSPALLQLVVTHLLTVWTVTCRGRNCTSSSNKYVRETSPIHWELLASAC